MKKIQISKLDAARRQILTAIRLYFNNDDIVSIHTLAAAAFKITQNICDSSPNLPDSLMAWIDELVKPEHKTMIRKKFHETANFFKHAENDTNAIHEFYPKHTEDILFHAVHQYRAITGEWLPEIHLYSNWYIMHNSEPFINPSQPEAVLALKKLTDFYGDDRNRFWRDMLPLAQAEIDKGIA